MTEVVGATASMLKLLDSTVRVCDHLDQYIRRVDEPPDSLRDINLCLPLFIETLRRTQFHIDHGHYNPTTSAMLKNFVTECGSKIILLEDILATISPGPNDSKVTRTSKALRSLEQEKKLEKIYSNISRYIELLLLFQSTVASNNTMAQIKAAQDPRKCLAYLGNSTMTVANISSTLTPAGRPSVGGESTSARGTVSREPPKRFSAYYKGGNRRRFSAFVGLSRLGLLWALQVNIDLSWGNYGFSINPSLRVQRLVKYTSPGFRVLWKLRQHLLDAQSAYDALLELFSSGRASPQDVNPDGMSLLERAIRIRITVSFPNSIVPIIRMLYEYGAPMNTTALFFPTFSRWDSWEPDLVVLRELISLNHDFSDTTLQDSLKRMRFPLIKLFSSFRNTDFDADTLDSYMLEFFRECSKRVYGFLGQTPLMDAIMCSSVTEVTKLLRRPQVLQDKNYLGQTPLHLAVLRPNVLSSVLGAGLSLNIRDNYGRSPLEYASAYGCVDSVIILLKAGADPFNGKHFTFMDHAMIWGHGDVVLQAYGFFRSARRFSDAFLKSEVDYLMVQYISRRLHSGPEDLRFLISLGADIHQVFKGGDTLLHLIWDDGQVDALFEAGYEYMDRPNLKGETALMKIIRHCHPLINNSILITNSILARGPNVNHRDNRGHSALHLICQQLDQRGTFHLDYSTLDLKEASEMIVLIAKILHQGIDPLCHDDCRCACSPDGCSPSTKLYLHDSYRYPKGYIWAMEWLLVLKELRGEATAQIALMQLVRAREFDKARMTHVCCRGGYFTMDEEEVDEILDEEKELISGLDDTMQQFVNSAIGSDIEEILLKILAGFSIPDITSIRSCMTWKGMKISLRDSPLGHSSNLQSLCALGSIQTSAGSEYRYWVDEANDEFLEEVPEIRIPDRIQVYSEWVEYFYNNRKKYDYPGRIDEAWYTRRKELASRQVMVLRAGSTVKLS